MSQDLTTVRDALARFVDGPSYIAAPDLTAMRGPLLFVAAEGEPAVQLDVGKLPPPVLAALARRATTALAEHVEQLHHEQPSRTAGAGR